MIFALPIAVGALVLYTLFPVLTKVSNNASEPDPHAPLPTFVRKPALGGSGTKVGLGLNACRTSATTRSAPRPHRST